MHTSLGILTAVIGSVSLWLSEYCLSCGTDKTEKQKLNTNSDNLGTYRYNPFGINPECHMSVVFSASDYWEEEGKNGEDICKSPFPLEARGSGKEASHVEQNLHFQTPTFLAKLALCSQGAPSHRVAGLCLWAYSLNLVSSSLLELKLTITAVTLFYMPPVATQV